MFKGKLITRSTHNRLPVMTSLLKSRRLYSSTVSQRPAGLAGPSYREELVELLLPGPVNVNDKEKKVTPMITKSELDKYFYPLFCRGWDIKSLSEAEAEVFRDPHGFPTLVRSPFLVHKYRFKGNRAARLFLKAIIETESKEKHHISFNLWSEANPVVTVMTQTHSTRRFDLDKENDGVTTDGIGPGLTLRDIRIAVLLQTLLDNPNNLMIRVPDSREYRSTERAIAWKILLSKYPFLNSQANSSSSNIVERLSDLAQQ